MTRNRFWVLLAVLISRAYSADFTAYIGDQNQYQVAAITTDSSGSTYVTGARIIQQQTGGSLDDVFVTKLDANGDIFTLPSRYCPSDLVVDDAARLFGATTDGGARVQAALIDDLDRTPKGRLAHLPPAST